MYLWREKEVKIINILRVILVPHIETYKYTRKSEPEGSVYYQIILYRHDRYEHIKNEEKSKNKIIKS